MNKSPKIILKGLKGKQKMTKTEFVKEIAAKCETTQKEAAGFVDAFIDTVTDALKAGDKVAFVGFGTFETRERAAREGRNPATGEKIKIAASKSPAFKAGKTLKDLVK